MTTWTRGAARPATVTTAWTRALPPALGAHALVLWLKADAIVGVANNANLTSWASSEGQAYPFTKPSYASGYPTYQTNVVNGLPVVRHVGSGAGVNKRLNYTAAVLRPARPTLFVVMAWKTASGGLYRMGPGCRSGAAQGFGIVRAETIPEYDVALCGLQNVDEPIAPISTYVGRYQNIAEPAAEQNGVFHILELAADPDTDSWYLATNGVNKINLASFDADIDYAHPTNGEAAAGSPFSTCCFYDTGLTEYSGIERQDLDLAEVVLFHRALTLAERDGVRQYLATKYSISITKVDPDQAAIAPDSPTILPLDLIPTVWSQP